MCDRPAFVAELLGGLLAVKVPPYAKAGLVDVTLNQVQPAEYRADAVMLFTRRKPVFGAIIEVQLRPEKRKRFTWPLYAVGARARERCPFVVLVVTPSAATAKWAASADRAGRRKPVPAAGDRAGWRPEAHRSRTRAAGTSAGGAVGDGAWPARGDDRSGGRRRCGHGDLAAPRGATAAYSLLIEANLSEAARKAIEMQPGLENYFSEAQRRNYERGRAEGEAKGRAEGEAKGKAEAVLKILVRRGVTLTAAQRRSIVECADLATVERWLELSLSASLVEELLASPSRASGNGHRRGRSAPVRRRRK
jgi:hypothetical protein